MSIPTLRGLAKAYSDGLIDRRRYVRARRQLIDDIVSGNVEIVAYEALGAGSRPDLDRTFSDAGAPLEIPRVDANDPPPPPSPAPQPAKSKSAIVITVIMVLAGIAGVAWFKLPQSSAPIEPAPIDLAAVDDDAEAPNPAEVLLLGFLDENQWQTERIDAFVLAWRKAPSRARRALADGPSMHRAAAAITQKIGDEKALLDLGDAIEAVATQRRLLDLAAALSLHNERIARLEDEWLETQSRVRASEQAAAEQDAIRPAPAPPPENVADIPASFEAPARSVDDDAPGADLPAAIAAGSSDPDVARAQELAPAPVADEPATNDDDDTASTQTPTPVAETAEVVAAATSTAPGETATTTGPTTDLELTQPTARRSPRKQSGCRAALAKQRRPYCRDPLTDKSSGPALVVLPGGEIEIGGRNPEEQPRRLVAIERPFALGIYEVSNKEFQAFCTATERDCPPQPWAVDPALPVVNVPWVLAMKYTQWLSEMTGASYRLPSESEWEYAARAGTSTVYPFGDDVLPTHARFSFRGIEKSPLASKDRSVNRNKFRLYHMIGNVREWVLDVWHENHAGAPGDGGARTGSSDQRVVRGGSFADGPDRIRSASRMHLAARAGDGRTGFRVLREID